MGKLFTLTLICFTQLLVLPHKTYGQSNEVKTLYFKTNSFIIDNKYLPVLNNFGQKCETDTFSFLKIFAYADKMGTNKYNEALSEKRATAVYNYLTRNFNIDTTRVYVTWLGEETDGAYDLHFPSANVQQRCVDILIFFKNP
jgi:outer membrane protein OmpA-like peptidoglycan-associated protein